MKVTGLDGRQYSWNFAGYEVYDNDSRPRSSFHLRARKIIRELFPVDTICEEVPIPGGSLRADFYIPSRRTLIEVHGQQHYKQSAHFHGSREKFQRAQANDRRKLEWCERNNITFIELSYEDNDDEWREQIFNS